MLAVVLINTVLPTDFFDLKTTDYPYIVGVILVGFVFLIIDRCLARKNVSNTEQTLRAKRGEFLNTIHISLVIAIAIAAPVAGNYFHKEADTIFFWGFTGVLIFKCACALYTGLLPMWKFEHIDRQREPFTFWIFTLTHILACILFISLLL